jgi:methionyl-tRNA synthetase
MWEALGQTTILAEQQWDTVAAQPLTPGQILPQPAIIFQKIPEEQIDAEIAKLYAGIASQEPTSVAPAPAPMAADLVTVDQVRQLQLRVAEVLSAEPIAGSRKLLKLTVHDGIGSRTVVSGIFQHYAPQDLIGKKVVIVANLQPSKLMGVESQGMLLAAQWDDNLEILTLQQATPGAKVS